MLTQLGIRNFAIIESLDLEFHNGITVFTGETGAGKSILMDALAMVLGARASTEYIRSGTDSLMLTAAFDVGNLPKVKAFLKEQNLLLNSDEDHELVISRRLDQSGKGRILINGMIAPLRILARLGERLVDIHGQNDHQKLASPAYQLTLLDTSSPMLSQSLLAYASAYQNWKQVMLSYQEGLAEQNERKLKKDTIASQVAEIISAKIDSSDEEEIIAAKLSRAEHAEKIITHVEYTLSALVGNDNAQEKLSHAVSALERAMEHDSSLSSVVQALEGALITIEESIRDLQDYVYDLEFSPDELLRLQNREQEIRHLIRKYGPTLTDVLSFADQAQIELNEIEHTDDKLQMQQNAVTDAKNKAEKLCSVLYKQREEVAQQLCQQILAVLRDLELEHARLYFQLEKGTEMTVSGLTQAELYFAPNPGENPKPLKDIASGGEMSRLSLALKVVSQKNSLLPTLVLDEVDVGISGNAAIRVGQLIRRIGRETQVLCITHLAQTAAVADHHIHLSKQITEGHTKTCAYVLNDKEHIQEIARMLEGDGYSSKAQETAVNLINQMK